MISLPSLPYLFGTPSLGETVERMRSRRDTHAIHLGHGVCLHRTGDFLQPVVATFRDAETQLVWVLATKRLYEPLDENTFRSLLEERDCSDATAVLLLLSDYFVHAFEVDEWGVYETS